MQVYCILDEFIIGGEIQETSKKVRQFVRVACSAACGSGFAVLRLTGRLARDNVGAV